MTTRLLRFHDLKQRQIVGNRVTLAAWIRSEGFPPGMRLARRSRAWTEAEIEEWLAGRPGVAGPRETEKQTTGN